MAIRKIRIYPDPILREKAKEIQSFDGNLAQLLDDMAETMYAASGIGLAAPQIGESMRVIVVDISDDRSGLIEIVNPEIVERSGSQIMEEGCLSIPDFRANVKRSKEVTVVGFDRYGKEMQVSGEGLLATVLQHEIDHINGILFIDHISALQREMFESSYRKKKVK